jgi:C-terminal processing protease CtpA/Prc
MLLTSCNLVIKSLFPEFYRMPALFRNIYFWLLLILLLAPAAAAQKLSGMERDRGQFMLKTVVSDIKKYYFDEKLRGIDLDAKAKAASEAIENAKSNSEIILIIAQVVFEFKDSHTRFNPPTRTNPVEYGWSMRMIGNRAFVVAVKPKSDADIKGLKVGDEVVTLNGYTIARETFWQMKYFFYSLYPQPGLKLIVKRPNGKEEELAVAAKVKQGKQVMDLTGANTDIWDIIRDQETEDYLSRHRYQKFGNELFIWKMPQFDMDDVAVDDMMDKVKECNNLILDLRGNSGGYVKMLNRLVGHFFDKDVKIADWKGRKEFEPQIAKTRGNKNYKGKVIVLIDSDSASAAEIFARVMQLEKRGTVLGDRSSGAVMVSRYYSHTSGVDVVSFFGSSITMADLIMTDGKSLENVGVMPDKLMLMTAFALAEEKDPVLSYAAELAGVQLDPATAGKMFPIEWKK